MEMVKTQQAATLSQATEYMKDRLRDMVEMLDSVGVMADDAIGDILRNMILTTGSRAARVGQVVADFRDLDRDLQESHPLLIRQLLHELFVDMIIKRDPRAGEIWLDGLQMELEDERKRRRADAA